MKSAFSDAVNEAWNYQLRKLYVSVNRYSGQVKSEIGSGKREGWKM